MEIPKVGNTVKIISGFCLNHLYDQEFTVTNYHTEFTDGSFCINAEFIDGSQAWVDASEDKWEIMTTVQEVEDNETAQILRTIDESIFYDGYKPAPSLAKANEVIAALVQVLVAKDLITASDVSRILKQVPAFTNVQSSKED